MPSMKGNTLEWTYYKPFEPEVKLTPDEKNQSVPSQDRQKHTSPNVWGMLLLEK